MNTQTTISLDGVYKATNATGGPYPATNSAMAMFDSQFWGFMGVVRVENLVDPRCSRCHKLPLNNNLYEPHLQGDCKS